VLAATSLGPRGGKSAEDAAKVVLAQKGIHEFESLPPSKDKSKLTGFFTQVKQKQPEPSKERPKASALASWRARPWEKDEPVEVDDAATYVNPLSMASSRSRHFVNMSSGW